MITSMLADTNILGAFLGAAVAYLVGALWYGPLFGSQWMQAVGKTKEQLREAINPWGPMMVQALYTLALAVLVLVLEGTAGIFGVALLIVTIVLGMLAGNMFEGRSLSLWRITASFEAVTVVIITLGIWFL